ncbi:MAG: hypothetical protein PW735_12080 [Acidobacteriaceae bacterium]|nr:hypothetical protein [Acidobacteriaceae bacterium]
MKFGKWLVVFFALGWVCSGAAQAQFSVYGLYQASRLSGMKCNDTANLCSGPVSNAEGSGGTTSSSSHVNFTGGWGGVMYDFKTVGPARLAIDVRGGEGHSNKSGTSYAGGDNATTFQSALAGLHATFHSPIRSVKPYAEFAVGWSRTNAAEQFAEGAGQSGDPGVTGFTPVHPRTYDNFFVYEGMVGLDIKILPIMDLRLPELEIGNMNMIGTQGSGATTTSMPVKSAALGLVFHIPSFH